MQEHHQCRCFHAGALHTTIRQLTSNRALWPYKTAVQAHLVQIFQQLHREGCCCKVAARQWSLVHRTVEKVHAVS